MLMEVAHLAECWVAVFIGALVRLLFGVDPKMSEKFTHSLYYSITFSLSIFRCVITLEQPVLLLEVVILLDVVERVLVAVWDMIGKSKHSWIKFFSLNYGNFISRLNFIYFHKFFGKNISTQFEWKIIHTVQVDLSGLGELLLDRLAVVLLIAPDLERSINFLIDFSNRFFFFRFLLLTWLIYLNVIYLYFYFHVYFIFLAFFSWSVKIVDFAWRWILAEFELWLILKYFLSALVSKAEKLKLLNFYGRHNLVDIVKLGQICNFF